MKWIRDHPRIVVPLAAVGVVVVAYLAFGVLGVQTLFFDDEVSEDVPVFDSGAGASGMPSDSVDTEMMAEMNEDMEEEGTPVVDEADEPMPDMPGRAESEQAPEIVSLLDGVFVPRSHPGEGTVTVLNDGTMQRFLRFEDFATDNGPDLNVYLTTADADAPADQFDQEFVDLGDLKGNIGPQNYEIPPDVDLERFDTVVVWCVRFSVAFTAADLFPVG
jgi:hypothetical protein